MDSEIFDVSNGSASLRRVLSACGFVAVVAGSIAARHLVDTAELAPARESTACAADGLARAAQATARVLRDAQDRGIIWVQAQPEAKERPIRGDFDRPLARRARGASNVTMHLVQKDDNGEVSVTINNDEVSATVDGEEVSKDRIRRTDDKVEVLDKHGEVIASFNVGGAGGAFVVQGGPGFGGFDPGEMRAFQFKGEPGEFVFNMDQPGADAAPAPKVMLGITMSQVDSEAAGELGLDEGVGIRIDHVYEGLPAHEAGLRDGDVITEVGDGIAATPDKLREVLRAHEVGDVVRVTYVRKGQERQAKVTLAAWDAEKLGGGATPVPLTVERFRGLGGAENQEAQKALELALKSLKESGHEDARRALEEAMKKLHEQQGQWWQGQQPGAGAHEWKLLLGDRPGQVYAPPREDSRLNDFDRRLDDLDKRMSDIDRRLERILSTLEKMERQGR